MTATLAVALALAALFAWRRLRLRRAWFVLRQQLAWSRRAAPRQRLVLDVGAGDNPHLRADVLCERFVDDDLHRSGAAARDRPLVAGDASALPFKSGSFDQIIARALIEHLRDPAAFFAEAARVAGGGLFVAPSAAWEQCCSNATHLWMIDRVDGGLRFTAKPAPTLHPDLQQFFASAVFRDAASTDDFLIEHWDALRITYEWSGRPACEVIGACGGADEGFISESTAGAPAQHRPAGIERLRRALKRWTRAGAHALLSAHRRIDLSAILACPGCRAGVTITADEVRCNECRLRYPVEEGVPMMLLERARPG
jgi:uncharacterized protein YbaR (Trm112 family)/SAM-dependent methyltransferase